jgi:hypothetical protein
MWFRVTVLASWLLSVLAASSAAQVTPEIREVMQSRLEAVWTKDAATWSRLTADEFTVVVPEGRLMTKSDRLAALVHDSCAAEQSFCAFLHGDQCLCCEL